MSNKLITWFEIPVSDFDRAKAFYEEIFGTELTEEEVGGKRFGCFPADPSITNGAIVKGEGYKPGGNGIQIFFEASGVIDDVLDRVEPAGGKISTAKTFVNEEIGEVAVFKDPEGNRIGLHAS